MTSVPTEPTTADHGDGGDEPEQPRTRRRGRRAFLIALVILLVLVAAAAGTAWYMVNRVSSNIDRLPDAFPEEEERPAELPTDAVTFLVGGLDGEGKVDVFEPGAARTDTIILAHIPEGHDRAYLVSIPRDTWVPIHDHGENKINAAYSFGGPALFVRTIEDLTGIRVNNLAMLDWGGFEELIDAVDGVTITVDEAAPLADEAVLEPGTHTLDGATALQYVRERKGLPGGDFDRVKRQQNVIRSLGAEILDTGTFTDPGRIADLTDAIGQAVRLDDTLGTADMLSMGLSMRDLRVNGMTFLTVPTLGTGTSADGQSIVVYDPERGDQLWQALAEDTVDDFLAANPDLITGDSVR